MSQSFNLSNLKIFAEDNLKYFSISVIFLWQSSILGKRKKNAGYHNFLFYFMIDAIFNIMAVTSAPINAFLEFFLPVPQTIFLRSHWLLSHITIVITIDSSERQMNPGAMTIVNPQKEYWLSRELIWLYWGLTPLYHLRSYHGSRWRTCVSWLFHTSANTTFLSKATDYFFHMLLQK